MSGSMMSSSPTPAPRNRATMEQEKASQSEQRSSVHQPEPHASSRGFLSLLNPPPVGAKTEKTGFLHLPDAVREMIYGLALFDHDRSAVFLPRKLPRKLEPGIDDVDVVCLNPICSTACDEVGFDPLYTQCYITSSSNDDASAAGQWTDSNDSGVEDPIDLGMTYENLADMTDQQLLELLEDNEDKDSSDAVLTPSESGGSNDLTESHVSAEDSQNADDVHGPLCACCAVSEDLLSAASAIELGEDGLDEEDDLKCANAFCARCQLSDDDLQESSDDPESHPSPCGDPVCPQCIDHPSHFEQSSTDNESNAITSKEHHHPDDLDHIDPDEMIGMLYEPREPGILLASKEIRSQCLPKYYCGNAFSWRFLWTDYQRSCKRYKAWIRSVSPENVRLITKITFQGRHVIEEGVEFSIDIDLIDQYPFFETNVYSAGITNIDYEISTAANRETANLLWRMVQTRSTRPRLTLELLCELANIFVQTMHRDGGGCVSAEAERLRLVLSPLF